ncbi:MAG TPA: hypothetical protein VEO73_01025 [Gemmatimonadales bacterium]|nr:hypothetical protein [Gemmatimonadales bacterium]
MVALLWVSWALLIARPPDRLSAQASLNVSFGARYTTTLVHDSIVSPFDIRLGIAPALTLVAGLPLEAPWTADGVLDLSYGLVSRHDQGGGVTAITHVTTLTLGVALRRDLRHGFSAAAGAGLLAYLPTERIGIFRDGGGPVVPMGTAAVSYSPPFAARRGLTLEARYDLHGFLTPALRTEGFVNSTVVHRVALALRYRLRGASGP